MFDAPKNGIKTIIILIITMLSLVLSSCNKTVNPDNDLINTAIDKHETITEIPEEIENATPEITQEAAIVYDQHIEDTLTSGNAKVVINADIMIPDYSEIPTVYLSPQNLSEDQFNKVVNELIGDNILYYQSADKNSLSVWSKEEIDDILSNLSDYFQNEDLDENTRYRLGKRIDKFENQYYPISSYKADEKIFDGTITSIDNSHIYSHVTDLKAYMNHDQAAWLNFSQSYKGNQTQIYFSNHYYGVYYDTLLTYKGIDAEKIDLSYDESLEIAKECVYAVDGEDSNMALSSSYIGYSTLSYRGYNMETSPQAYCFDFGRGYDDMVINPTVGLMYDIDDISKEIRTEKIRIIIDNDGINEFSWMGYSEFRNTQYESIQILEFNEINNIFKNYCNNNRIWTPNNDQLPSDLTATININAVRLDLMLVSDGNDGYKTCPVWNYVGDVNYDKDAIEQDGAIAQGEQNVIILTINAVDGSIMQYPQKMN